MVPICYFWTIYWTKNISFNKTDIIQKLYLDGNIWDDSRGVYEVCFENIKLIWFQKFCLDTTIFDSSRLMRIF